MKKKILVLLIAALTLTGALAQDSSIETRLSIVENRLSRLEVDVGRLSEVPTALARIEEKITALTERATGNSSVLQTVGLSTVTFLLGGGITWLFRSKGK